MGTCSGANVVFPPLGAHVLVVGPFVHDEWVGWNEIHPAWYVEVIPAGGPPPPEQHTAKARLTGSAVPGGIGVRGASAVLRTTLTGTRLCWTFSAIKGISRLGRAEVRSISGGRLAFRLGSRFRAKGCESLPRAKAERFGKNVHAFSAVVYASGRRGAALRGRLTPTSD